MQGYNPNLYNTGSFQTQPYQPQSGAISGSYGSYQAPSYPVQGSGSGGGGFETAGSTLNAGGDAAMASGNPYVKAGGMVTKAIGAGFDMYGKYQAREDAKKQHEEALARYNEEKRIEAEDRAREQNRQDRQEAYSGGQYSQNLEDRFAGGYGGYRQPGTL